MTDFPDDYAHWRECVAENLEIFRSEKSFKHELHSYRDEWRRAGVIIETGTGRLRRRVLVSRSRYINFWRERTKRGAA